MYIHIILLYYYENMCNTCMHEYDIHTPAGTHCISQASLLFL